MGKLVNPALIQIDNLDSLYVSDQLEIRGNRSLQSIGGLGSFGSLSSLTIGDNVSLRHIDGLAGLSQVDFDLSIYGNALPENSMSLWFVYAPLFWHGELKHGS